MQVAHVKPGRVVKCGGIVGRFLRMSGPDAIVELDTGRRLLWSGGTEVETLSDREEVQENILPRLEAELSRLESFTVGKYAPLGLTAETPCIELPKSLHHHFVRAALGKQPDDAVVCRRCTTMLCVRADHLFWGTRSDCQRDMCLRGLARPGGKAVDAVSIATRILKLRIRITRLKNE